MTFAAHLERQFLQRLQGAGWVNASLYLRARASCKRCYKKAGSKNKIRVRKMRSSIG
jgi:hypothetical protein